MFGKKKKQMEYQKKKEEKEKQQKADYKTVDYSKIKDFLNWGMNRALSDLRLRRMVDVKLREERMKKGPQRDFQKIMLSVVVIVVAGGLAFMMITQFLNYDEVSQKLSQCIIEVGHRQVEVDACQAKLQTEPVAQLVG